MSSYGFPSPPADPSPGHYSMNQFISSNAPTPSQTSSIGLLSSPDTISNYTDSRPYNDDKKPYSNSKYTDSRHVSHAPSTHSAVFELEASHPQTKLSWTAFWFSLIFGFLWIGPTTVLLVLNFKEAIIGASTWCPAGYCPVPSFYNKGASIGPTTAKYDDQNHDLLGVLQFIAKAVEVWFVFVAVSLVYMVTVLLARMKRGMPLGYLTTYVEFSDLRIVFDPVFWTAWYPGKGKTVRKRNTGLLYLFVGFAALMCLLTNMMGPSVAVLMIPTLQWRETPKEYSHTFHTLLSPLPPTGDNSVQGCLTAQLDDYDFTCTRSVYGDGFDAMIEYTAQELAQSHYSYGTLANFGSPSSIEAALSFEFNATSPKQNQSDVFWAPSRQVIRSLAADYQDFAQVARGNVTDSPHATYNNSLQLILQREGPVIGLGYTWNIGTVTKTIISSSRYVRCYKNWTYVDNTEYAKCFRVGYGWNVVSDSGYFSIGANDTTDFVNVNLFSCDKAVYLKTRLSPSDTPACLPNGTLPVPNNCDFDKIFSSNELQVNGVEDHLSSMSLIEFALPNGPMPSTRMIAETFAKVGFATYSVDLTTTSIIGLASINSYPDWNAEVTPITISPAWLLAAWSTKLGSTVSETRGAARILKESMGRLFNTYVRFYNDPRYRGIMDDANYQLSSVALYSILQAATLIPYNITSQASSTSSFSEEKGPNLSSFNNIPPTPYKPSLSTNFRRQVWAYGFDSRSSKVGLIVVGLGMISVLLRTILGLITRIRHREPVEMLASAMQHKYRQEFYGCNEQAERMAKVRFRVYQSGGGVGFEKRD